MKRMTTPMSSLRMMNVCTRYPEMYQVFTNRPLAPMPCGMLWTRGW
jgi:hypothetical protein